MGTPPFFLSRDTNISSIYGIVCPLCPYCVFPLAVPFCASCPCYILSWWKRSRGSCGVNGQLLIYMGRLVVLLVAAFRLLVLFFFSFLVSSLVSFIVSSVRLVAASRCCVPCLSFRFVSSRVVFAYCLVVYLVVAFYVVGVSCHFSVSCLVSFFVSLFFSSCLVVSLSWRVAARVGRGGVGGGDGVLLSSCDVVAVASCFPCSGWLGGGRSIGLRRFIQLVLVRICGCRDLARGKMASI